jgi:CubicO group peptidase (beta-lactamase class C family)
MVQNLQNEYVTNPPNYMWSYSNAAMTILGHTVCAVSGVEYSDYIRDEFLRPLGMHQSFIANLPPADNPLMSKKYRNGVECKLHPFRDIPAGGLCSTVTDMARFMQMIFAGGAINGQHVLNPATIDEMLRVQNENIPLDCDFRMGLGWFRMDGQILDYGGKVAGHGGTLKESITNSGLEYKKLK